MSVNTGKNLTQFLIKGWALSYAKGMGGFFAQLPAESFPHTMSNHTKGTSCEAQPGGFLGVGQIRHGAFQRWQQSLEDFAFSRGRINLSEGIQGLRQQRFGEITAVESGGIEVQGRVHLIGRVCRKSIEGQKMRLGSPPFLRLGGPGPVDDLAIQQSQQPSAEPAAGGVSFLQGVPGQQF